MSGGWRRQLFRLAGAAALLAGAEAARAHDGAPHAPDAAWWTQWNLDPLVPANVALLSILYFIGLRRMWARAGEGHGVGRVQAAAFAAAMLAVIVALASPLDPLSDVLGSAHMVQHMLLMLVAAPLFVLGSPGQVMVWALPRPARQALAGARAGLRGWQPAWYVLWQPLLAWSLFALTLWVWHLPALYEAALRGRVVHEAQHLMFFVTACLYWRVLADPISRRALNRGAGVMYLFTTSLHATVLGVFMALAPRPWYGEYVGRTELWRLTALEDQQLAGLIMWMPACAIYALVAAGIFWLWIREDAAGGPEAPLPQPLGEGGMP